MAAYFIEMLKLLAIDAIFVFILALVLTPLAQYKRAAFAVLKRNFVGYFANPTGYVFLCLFVFLTSAAAFWPHEFFVANLANLDQLNKYMPLILLIFVPFPGEQIAQLVGSIFSSEQSGADLSMTLMQDLLTMNLIMGCFNLVPVFPMDGGRVLRALLATKLSYLKATFYAASLAKVLATLAVVAAAWHGHVQLAVLFAFIFFAGEMEYRAVKRRERDDARWRRMLAELEAATAAPPPLPDISGRSS